MPHLARLRLLASDGAGAPLPPGIAGEAVHPARAIVAETGTAGQAAVAAVAESGRGSAALFLAARQARLAAAADDVVAAAEDGSAAALSRALRRFEALTTALWTVQLAICSPAHRRPGPAHLAGPAAIGGREGNGVNAAGSGLTWARVSMPSPGLQEGQ